MKNKNSFVKAALVGVAALIGTTTLLAFPPAPHHLIKGTVRDQLGYPVESEGTVVLTTVTGVTIQVPLTPSLFVDSSYKMEVPMDAGVAPDSYKPTALNPLVPFTMEVRIGTQTFLPFQMSGDYATLGIAGGTSIIDLTFGVDSDGDGLPDLWEELLIQKLARLNGLEDVNPDDDLDGDGLSNYEEYLAQTYAYNVLEGLALRIKTVSDDAYTIEFLVIDGHSYTIRGSADLAGWEPVAFRVESGELVTTYASEEVERIEVEVPRTGSTNTFFKLQIQ